MKKQTGKKIVRTFSAIAAGSLLLGLNVNSAQANEISADLFSYNDLGTGSELRADLLAMNTLTMKHFDANAIKRIEAGCAGHNHDEKAKEDTGGDDKKAESSTDANVSEATGDSKAMESTCGGDKKAESSTEADISESTGDAKAGEATCGGDAKAKEATCGEDKASGETKAEGSEKSDDSKKK